MPGRWEKPPTTRIERSIQTKPTQTTLQTTIKNNSISTWIFFQEENYEKWAFLNSVFLKQLALTPHSFTWAERTMQRPEGWPGMKSPLSLHSWPTWDMCTALLTYFYDWIPLPHCSLFPCLVKRVMRLMKEPFCVCMTWVQLKTSLISGLERWLRG